MTLLTLKIPRKIVLLADSRTYHSLFPKVLFVCLFSRLLFLANGTHECTPVVNIKDIKDVEAMTYSETILSRLITAIKITSKCKVSSLAKTSLAIVVLIVLNN